MVRGMENEPVGIIAGGGQFPRLVAETVRKSGGRAVVCGFHGHTDPDLRAAADVFCLLRLGQFNRVLAFFRRQGVRRVCMAGAINKPRALDFRPDLRALRIVFSLRRKGDDALLRAIIRFGWPVGASLGRFDIGQCLVVKQGMVVAVECLEGTDAALRRGGELGGAGCVALKMAKPGQDERADLPSVGLETIRRLVEGKYRCLAVEAEKTLFFDMEAALALADRHDLAVVALRPEEVNGTPDGTPAAGSDRAGILEDCG